MDSNEVQNNFKKKSRLSIGLSAMAAALIFIVSMIVLMRNKRDTSKELIALTKIPFLITIIGFIAINNKNSVCWSCFNGLVCCEILTFVLLIISEIFVDILFMDLINICKDEKNVGEECERLRNSVGYKFPYLIESITVMVTIILCLSLYFGCKIKNHPYFNDIIIIPQAHLPQEESVNDNEEMV